MYGQCLGRLDSAETARRPIRNGMEDYSLSALAIPGPWTLTVIPLLGSLDTRMADYAEVWWQRRSMCPGWHFAASCLIPFLRRKCIELFVKVENFYTPHWDFTARVPRLPCNIVFMEFRVVMDIHRDVACTTIE